MSTDHYIATSDIPFGDPGRGVYAHRAGDRVPAENVKANGWADYVATPGTKAAQQATTGAAGESSPAPAGRKASE